MVGRGGEGEPHRFLNHLRLIPNLSWTVSVCPAKRGYRGYSDTHFLHHPFMIFNILCITSEMYQRTVQVLLYYAMILYPAWKNQMEERVRIAKEMRDRMRDLRQGYFCGGKSG